MISLFLSKSPHFNDWCLSVCTYVCRKAYKTTIFYTEILFQYLNGIKNYHKNYIFIWLLETGCICWKKRMTSVVCKASCWKLGGWCMFARLEMLKQTIIHLELHSIGVFFIFYIFIMLCSYRCTLHEVQRSAKALITVASSTNSFRPDHTPFITTTRWSCRVVCVTCKCLTLRSVQSFTLATEKNELYWDALQVLRVVQFH